MEIDEFLQTNTDLAFKVIYSRQNDKFSVYCEYSNQNIDKCFKEILMKCINYLNQTEQLTKFDLNFEECILIMKLNKRAPLCYTLDDFKSRLNDYINTIFTFACKLVASIVENNINQSDVYFHIKQALAQ